MIYVHTILTCIQGYSTYDWLKDTDIFIEINEY